MPRAGNHERLLVFCRDGEGGNPATVVWCGHERPATEDLQRLAAKHGTPVTAFIVNGDPAKVRFFSPSSELPFCGHGALAAGSALAEARGARSAEIRAVASRRHLTVELGEPGIATLVMSGPPEVREETDRGPVLAALGVEAGEVDGSLPFAIGDAGSPKWLVPVRSREALLAVRPRMADLAALSGARGVNGAYVYTTRGTSPGVDALARGFNPRAGTDEDAATGVAAAPLAAALRPGGPERRTFVVEQGIGLRQLNRIQVALEGDRVLVGGEVRRPEE